MTRILSIALLLISTVLSAQVQSPAEFLGYEMGTQFTRHADVVSYFEHVAENSAMVTFDTYGKTNERRPLTYAIISSEGNISTIKTLRTNHLTNAGIQKGTATSNTAIVWMSYNVHGNEASSTEAAMNTIYKLITEKKDYLQNTVVLIDPCVNPDGRDRYVNWYNQVKSTPYNKLQDAAEHHEPWPGGRPNHYLFDLNRDWAWATQVESQQRLKIYNQWMPHVHVDFHEQGINNPYYFAPAAEPFHEIITDFQRDFQTEIGKNHARYFDKEGWLFFTRESFDLLYPSYGDTYPMFMGAIGMTYEQAGHGRAGLGIDTDEGYELTLVDRVAHHTTTGLSTIEVASKNANKLVTEFKNYFSKTNFTYKSYVLKGHPDKLKALTTLLDRHEIVYGYTNSGTVNGYNYTTATKSSMDATGALVVSTNQPKGNMVKVLFEPDAKLSDPLTYDITAWSIPHAYGLEALASTSLINATATTPNKFKNTSAATPSAAGYIADWNSVYDAAFLSELLKQDIRVRFSEKELQFNGKTFNRGSLIITKSDNRTNNEFDQKVIKIAKKHQRNLYAATTSFSDNGTDFGSPDLKLINTPRVAMLKGKGVSSLSYGTLWHFFETQLQYPITSVDTDYFDSVSLNTFDILVLPDGWYSSVINEERLKEITAWVRRGGKIISLGNAVRFFEGKEGFDLTENKPDTTETNEASKAEKLIPYDQRERNGVTDLITGSIYKIKLDPSHPMAFGYGDSYFSLKLGSDSYQFLENGYNVGYIQDEPISVSGFSGKNAKAKLKNSMVFGEARMGRGSMIYIVDDVLFRSFWENGKLLFVNSLFFVNPNRFRE
ncbi:M14 family zinc carboxypeptidase [Cochleicola gelatinilyticus]|uniref:Zinc carboxypeptidase n=1 Tax=Cochleicola gelatinilyticus TaxID=1763537 RepID=A0A167K941_9FLAO|nr:M14 family zinc carboxypeptidase [Cochleicola gelatinilyticus]OAB81519.1 zinc carboxypeptidase [Cochleicola gelatinilyticus]